MQFTSTIIVALFLAVSTSTVTAAQNTSNLRSGRKLQEENELNLRDLRACQSPISIQSGDTCNAIRDACAGDWASLDCVQAGTTCTNENSKLIVGDSCSMLTGCKTGCPGTDFTAPGSFCGNCYEDDEICCQKAGTDACPEPEPYCYHKA